MISVYRDNTLIEHIPQECYPFSLLRQPVFFDPYGVCARPYGLRSPLTYRVQLVPWPPFQPRFHRVFFACYSASAAATAAAASSSAFLAAIASFSAAIRRTVFHHRLHDAKVRANATPAKARTIKPTITDGMHALFARRPRWQRLPVGGA